MNPAEKAIEVITTILDKYTDQMDLLDIIEIVDNLRIILENTSCEEININTNCEGGLACQ
ncbi:MAG: hypothetical protein VR68_04765 [Peptococcaceae bacterium BRH_c4a]|nr:MAG: hypothetical protein VR68_04765 [Peptococcaceae bacterium BRH_c4a]